MRNNIYETQYIRETIYTRNNIYEKQYIRKTMHYLETLQK